MISVALSRQLAHALNVPAFFALPFDEQERIRALFQQDSLGGSLSDAGKQALVWLSPGVKFDELLANKEE